MNDIRMLLSECSGVLGTPIFTEAESKFIEESIVAIEGIEWPGLNEELDPKMEISSDDKKQLKSKALIALLKIIIAIKDSKKALGSIAKKAEEFVSKGIIEVSEMYNNLMSDKPFLSKLISDMKSGSKFGAEMSAQYTGVLSISIFLVFAVIAVYIMISANSKIEAVKILTTEVIPMFIKAVITHAAKVIPIAIAIGASAGGTYAIGSEIVKEKSLSKVYKTIIKDIVSLIKDINIKNIKNKFRNYEVED